MAIRLSKSLSKKSHANIMVQLSTPHRCFLLIESLKSFRNLIFKFYTSSVFFSLLSVNRYVHIDESF